MLSAARLRTTRPWACGGTIALAVALLLSYRYMVAPWYGYLGYTWADPDWGILALAIVALGGLSLLLPTSIDRPSDFMLWIVFTTVVLPVMVISNVIGLLTVGQIIELCWWISVAFGLAALMARWGKQSFNLPLPRISPKVFWAGFALVVLGSLGLLVLVNGVRLDVTGLMGVYDVRDSYRENLKKLPQLAYLVSMLSYIALPLLLIRGLHRRSVPIIAVALGLQVFVFAQTGFRTFLFGAAVVIVLAFVLIGRRIATPLIPMGLTFGVVVAAMLDLVLNTVVFSSYFSRRFLATPGQLAANYVKFFSDHQFVFLSEGVLRTWIVYPYDLAVPYLIGREVHGISTNSANVNFLTDGFAQGGWLGMVIAGFVFGVVLVLVDWASRGLPTSVGCMLMLMPCVVLGNSSILTTLLTHGLFAGIVVLALVPRSGWEASPVNRPVGAFSLVGQPR